MTALSYLHIGGIIFTYGGITFAIMSMPPPFMLAGEIPPEVIGGTMGIFLPVHWAVLPIVITAGILKIFEHLTKIQDMGPALGTLYGKTVLTKMLVGSIFITNAMLITGGVVVALPFDIATHMVPLMWI
jgi:hypothetical protein